MGIIKAFSAENEISERRIVAAGSEASAVKQANASDVAVGVSGIRGGQKGDVVDVALTGIHRLDFGGDVSAWSFVKSDADGRAVKAASGDRAIGIALDDGVEGSYGDVLIQPQIAP